jgi:thiamine-phosphate pyrophosphorylase
VKSRLFLVAPEHMDARAIASCVVAAHGEGDVASIVLPASAAPIASELQAIGMAVLFQGPGGQWGDGVHLDAERDDIASLRRQFGPARIIGAYCGASRHFAMQAGEAGADYVALAQNAKSVKEPIVGWWSQLFEIPCVAFEPAELADLDILLPQKPDFIRPSEQMWEGAAHARQIVSDMMRRIER